MTKIKFFVSYKLDCNIFVDCAKTYNFPLYFTEATHYSGLYLRVHKKQTAISNYSVSTDTSPLLQELLVAGYACNTFTDNLSDLFFDLCGYLLCDLPSRLSGVLSMSQSCHLYSGSSTTDYLLTSELQSIRFYERLFSFFKRNHVLASDFN